MPRTKEDGPPRAKSGVTTKATSRGGRRAATPEQVATGGHGQQTVNLVGLQATVDMLVQGAWQMGGRFKAQ
jgi:hypothetical protein